MSDCRISQGRQLNGCQKNNVGGIKAVYIANHTEVTGTTISMSGSTLDMVTAIAMSGASVFYKFDTVKETSSWSEALTVNIQNGTLSFVPNVSLIFNKLESTTRNIIQMLAISVLDIVVQDQNDNYFYLGRVNGMDLTAVETGTGVALGDRNGSTLTFAGAEPEAARQIDSTFIAGGWVAINSYT